MIVAIIPTRFSPPTLGPLLDVLKGDGIPTILLQSEDFGHELHVMWNTGVDRAVEMGATEVALLNDDIDILPGTLDMMAAAIRSHENASVVFPQREPRVPKIPSTVAFSIEPIADVGHCFMIKAEQWGTVLPRFDEGYHLWHGDLIFFAAVRDLGRDVIMVRKLYVNHLQHFSVDKVRYTRPVFEDMIRNRQTLDQPADWTGRRASKRLFDQAHRKYAKAMREATE